MENENKSALIGQQLKKLRHQTGLSQEKLAYELKLTKKQVGKIEKGEAFTSKSIQKFFDFFDVREIVLITREEEDDDFE